MKITDAAVLGLLGGRKQRQEQTTTANVGAFPVPIGPVLRRVFPEPAKKRKRKRQEGEIELDVTGAPDSTELFRRAVEELARLR